MHGLIEVPLETGGSLLVEVDEELEPGVVRVGRAGEASLEQLKPMAAAVVDRVRTIEHPPRHVDVEFGIKLTAQAGLGIAASSGEANLKVSLSWERSGPDP